MDPLVQDSVAPLNAIDNGPEVAVKAVDPAFVHVEALAVPASDAMTPARPTTTTTTRDSCACPLLSSWVHRQCPAGRRGTAAVG
jgi:hypothetical protein